MKISPFVVKPLVTISVAVLAFAIFCSWIDRRREASRKLSCQSNLKQIGLGLAEYAQDYDGHLPLVIGSNHPGKSYLPAYGWADALIPYTKSINIISCPSDIFPQGDRTGAYSPTSYFTDYWMNARLNGAKASGLDVTRVVLSGDGIGDTRGSARYALSSPPDEQVVCGGNNGQCQSAWKHLGGANFLFVDGHVKWLLPAGVSTSKGDRFTFAP